MSLPKFEMKGSLFESLGSIAADLFDEKDKYTTSLRAKFGLCWRATGKKWRNVTSQKSLSRDGLVGSVATLELRRSLAIASAKLGATQGELR